MHPFRDWLGRKTPWWGISFLVHAIAIFILANWKLAARPREVVTPIERTVGIREVEREKPPLPPVSMTKAPEPPSREPPIEKQPLKEVVDSPARSEADKRGRTAVLSVDGGAFGQRSVGARERAVKQGGGGPTEISESAVESGLLWLAAKQLSTGSWRAESEGARWADPGLSGLATMAFLGAGYTHKSGKYMRTVERALAYLKSQQDREGCIALTEDNGKRTGEGRVSYMYCHATATLALVEAYGMTKDPLLRESAQRAIDFICQCQNPTGGWRYHYNSLDGDSSVSGWMVMALRSASLSGLDVPDAAFKNARRFFDSVTDKEDGRTCYLVGPAGAEAIAQKDGQTTLLLRLARPLDAATVNERLAAWNLGATAKPVPEAQAGPARRFHILVPSDKAAAVASRIADERHVFVGYLRTSVALDAVGLLCHQYLGIAADDPYIERAGAVINASPPKWVPEQGLATMPIEKLALLTRANNYYYWYYANLALHQRRGKAWDKWHPQVRDLLCRIQERKGDREGSWPPLTYGGSAFGRVYSTALAILTLEVYYRYSPLYRETVDEVLAAYGDALGAYNHFVRQYQAKKPDAAADARKKAVENINRFLALSESKTEKADPKRTAEQRGQAGLMLVRLHQAGGDIEQAIAILKSLPDRFPDLLTTEELVRWLADLYRIRAQQLTEEGDTEGARRARAGALKLYFPVVSKSLGKNPELELWLAGGFFEREEWQKALDLYKAQLGRVSFERLDPKGEEGRTVVAILDRLIKCSTSLRMYKAAAQYLDQLEGLIGVSVATRSQQAEIRRLLKDYTGARRIYDDLLARLPEYSKEWWEKKYEQLFMAYLEDRADYVVKSIGILQLSHPDLGGDDLKPRILDLLDRAQNTKPPAKPLPESPLR